MYERNKIDAIDLILGTLRDHEKNLSEIAHVLTRAVKALEDLLELEDRVKKVEAKIHE